MDEIRTGTTDSTTARPVDAAEPTRHHEPTGPSADARADEIASGAADLAAALGARVESPSEQTASADAAVGAASHASPAGETQAGAPESDGDTSEFASDDDEEWEELSEEEEAQLAAAYAEQQRALAQVPPNPPLDPTDAAAVAHACERLRTATMAPLAQIVDASNGVLLVRLEDAEGVLHAVYKPTVGEAPLWDFPPMTLAQREVATFEIACAAGIPAVPPTVLRTDGSHGPGSLQWWVSVDAGADPAVDILAPGEVRDDQLVVLQAQTTDGNPLVVVHRDDEALRRIALLDAVVNNADRKGSALLATTDRLWGIDHGICLHAEPKLRTVLWGWAGEPLDEQEKALLMGLDAALDGDLGARLAELLLPEEVDALRARVQRLLATGQWPLPHPNRPAIPWPVL